MLISVAVARISMAASAASLFLSTMTVVSAPLSEFCAAGIRASVQIQALPYRQGVRRSSPSSPSVFALFCSREYVSLFSPVLRYPTYHPWPSPLRA
jgi:hypothetical protein